MKKKIILLFLLASQVCFGQNLKISQLPVATTPLAGTELIPIVQNGVTKQTTVSSIGISAPCCGLINGNPTETGNLYVGTPAAIGITGTNNVVTGVGSAAALTTGAYNAVLGAGSLVNTTTGSSNVGVGNAVLASNISGSLNVALGSASLGSNITGNDLTAIGAETDVATDGLSNSIALGYGAVITASNQLVIGSAATHVTSLVINTVPYTMPSAQGAAATVLTDNGSGTLSWAPATTSLTSTYIGYGSSGGALTGDNSLTYSGAAGTFQIGVGNPVSAIAFQAYDGTDPTVKMGDVGDNANGSLFEINDPNRTLSWNKPTTILNNVTYNWTGTQGSANTVLTNDGSGNLSWASPSGSGTVTSITAGTGLTGGTITSSGTIGLSSPVAVTNGGTGQTSAGAAINALLPSQSGNSGDYLTTNGTSASWGAVSASITSTQIGYGSGSNTLTSSNDLKWLNYNAGVNAIYLNDRWGNAFINGGFYNIPFAFTGTNNTALGFDAMYYTGIIDNNTAIGYQALYNGVGTTYSMDYITAIGSGTGVNGNYQYSTAIGGLATIDANHEIVFGGTAADSESHWKVNGVDWYMPTSQGGSSQVLTNDGAGQLSWATVSGGGSPSLTSTYIGYGNGSNVLTGDANFERNNWSVNLEDNSSGQNLFIGLPGFNAGKNSLTGSTNDDIGIGGKVMNNIKAGATDCVIIGWEAGKELTSGGQNTAVGVGALLSDTSGYENVAIGQNTLTNNYSGHGLTVVGSESNVNFDGINNSIALGVSTGISRSGQFEVSPFVSNFVFNGDSMIWPSSNAAGALTNDGSGNLSWGHPAIQLLGKLTGADLNYSGDQAITLNGGTTYVITNIVYTNVSADLTASGILQTQINTGASLSGNYIEYENEFVALMSNSSQFMDWNVANSISITERPQHYIWIQPSSSIMGYTATSPVYFSDLVLNGSAATCDIYVYGYILN